MNKSFSALLFAVLFVMGVLGTLVSFAPAHVFAAEFVQQPLFLSKSPVTEGQKVRIYANVSNGSATPFTGIVLIQNDGVRLGSSTTSLAIGATQTVSVSWTPTAGPHVITAQLIADDGTVVQQVSNTFTILAIPVPAATTSPITLPTVVYESSTPIQQAVANILPTVATGTKPFFTLIDTARSAVARALDSQIAVAHAARGDAVKGASTASMKTTASAAVHGSSTAASGSDSPFHLFWTLYLYFLTLLAFFIDKPWVFYPLGTIIFFYILLMIYRRVRRYRRNRRYDTI